MKKIYYLKTCDTCKRILKSIPLDGFVLQEIKSEPITIEQLEEMKELSGTYESLFSRRAQKYKQMGLKDKTLDENNFKELILQEYTFLKRPIILVDSAIFIGNSKANINLLQKHFNL